jgi:hypothetical protein
VQSIGERETTVYRQRPVRGNAVGGANAGVNYDYGLPSRLDRGHVYRLESGEQSMTLRTLRSNNKL